MGKTIFKSEPLIDWSKEEERTKLSKALREVRGNLGALYHPIIAGKNRQQGEDCKQESLKSG